MCVVCVCGGGGGAELEGRRAGVRASLAGGGARHRRLRCCCHTCAPPFFLLLQVLEYIGENMPPESPVAFGLHPNAEVGCRLREAAAFCDALQLLQVRGRWGE